MMPADMIEYTIHNDPDAFFMGGLDKDLEVVVRSKAGIDMQIVHHVIFMIGSCCKNRVQIKAVEAHLLEIIQIFQYAAERAAIGGVRRELVVGFPFSLFADTPFPIRKTVRENVIDDCIVYPIGNDSQVSFVIKGVLEILAALDMRIHSLKAVSGKATLFLPIIQQEIIGDPLPRCFQCDFIPIV